MNSDWVQMLGVFGFLYLIPTLICVNNPKNALGSFCGWLLVLEPGAAVVLGAILAIRRDGFGWSLVFFPIVLLVVVLVFWGPAVYGLIEQCSVSTRDDFYEKLGIYDRVFSLFSSDRDVEQDSDWEEISDLTGTPYQAYLLSAEWKQRRSFMLERAQYACEHCGMDRRLEIHHLTYKRLGNERISDLVVLCHSCHADTHQRSVNRRTRIKNSLIV